MKKGQAINLLDELAALGVLSDRANVKIQTEIEKRLEDSIEKSKQIIESNKGFFKKPNKNDFMDLFKIYSEQNSVLSLAISI